MYGVSNVNYGSPYSPRYNSYSRQTKYNPQYQQNNNNGGSFVGNVLKLGAAVAAVAVLKKPLGKLLAPLGQKIAQKAPKLATAAGAVKGRFGRLFTKVGEKVNKHIPNIKKAATDAATDVGGKVKNNVIPTLKDKVPKAVNAVKDTFNEKVAPKLTKFKDDVLDKIIQWGNKGA